MNAQQLVSHYIDFFIAQGHAQITSASVIPENDPTVLFTTAGMHPLVPYLMGEKHPAGNRLVDFQRCVRTGDIDEVGDATHNTFFTMLGNWSLGDYFKKESITWSFDFLTGTLNIPLEMLAVTVYQGDDAVSRDDESAQLWMSLGVQEQRIAYLGKADNWWGPVGETGPCGPDTEIFYWTGEGNAPEVFDPENELWVEVWNNVFMEYNKNADGTFTPLTRKNVDTGMGLERILMALQGKNVVYDIDLFQPIIGTIETITGETYGVGQQSTESMRVIADHLRTATVMIADGIVPSNKDQGYVLRRLIRRSVRHARKLGVEQAQELLVAVSATCISTLEFMYPHLRDQQSAIANALVVEGAKFERTLQKGLKELHKIWEKKAEITGDDAFNLYQSYGFPLEITEEVAQEFGQQVDHGVFRKQFEQHQNTSRAGAEKKFAGGLADHSAETVRLHTATHLLHRALKNILGEDVEQKGSNITPQRLRFDFNYAEKLTDEQKQAIEDMVNEQIKKELPVHFEEITPEEAKARGAIGYFDDKYATLGNKLKVYFVGDDEQGYFSSEICGGPHVENTRELEHFTLKKEEACSAGVRRIKATVSANKP